MTINQYFYSFLYITVQKFGLYDLLMFLKEVLSIYVIKNTVKTVIL